MEGLPVKTDAIRNRLAPARIRPPVFNVVLSSRHQLKTDRLLETYPAWCHFSLKGNGNSPLTRQWKTA